MQSTTCVNPTQIRSSTLPKSPLNPSSPPGSGHRRSLRFPRRFRASASSEAFLTLDVRRRKNCSLEFPGRRCFRSGREAGEFTETSEFDAGQDCTSDSLSVSEEPSSILNILKGSNSFLPHVVVASTCLALFYPPSFSWFTNRYYAPALGFLMFAVGVNSSERDFLEAFKRPAAIFAGYIGQFIVKPLLGYMFGILAVSVFALPTPIGAGIMLVSCVSGAQLSNYATFLTDPPMAPLSIVMTSLSTASAVFVTPFLSLLLIGKRLPVDVIGMVSSILQIVVAPIAAGLLLNRFFPWICNAIRPFLPPLSVLVTACCIGAPLAINVERIVSPFGLKILLLIITFHLCAFIIGYLLPGVVFRKTPDVKALQRTLSYETGMQSSLLALALANKFFQDPLVAVPPAISTVMMSVMGFSLVLLWAKKNTAN